MKLDCTPSTKELSFLYLCADLKVSRSKVLTLCQILDLTNSN